MINIKAQIEELLKGEVVKISKGCIETKKNGRKTDLVSCSSNSGKSNK